MIKFYCKYFFHSSFCYLAPIHLSSLLPTHHSLCSYLFARDPLDLPGDPLKSFTHFFFIGIICNFLSKDMFASFPRGGRVCWIGASLLGWGSSSAACHWILAQLLNLSLHTGFSKEVIVLNSWRSQTCNLSLYAKCLGKCLPCVKYHMVIA